MTHYVPLLEFTPLKPSIDLLRAAGIATIAATGNNGLTSQNASPACISSTIAVGSSLDTADTASPDSNNSVILDLYAPGDSITSSIPGGGFAQASGTSFAAAHVAGAWAVFKHAASNLSVNAMQNILENNGPLITKSGVQRRRLDITAVLNSINPGNPGNPGNPNPGGSIVPILQLLLLD